MKKIIHFSRKLLLAALVSFPIILIFRIPSVFSQEVQPDPCTLGDLYLQAGQLDKAEETYADLLTNNPQEACAITGMQAVAKQRKVLLQIYMDAGDFEKAKEVAILLLAQSTTDQSVKDDYHTILTQIAITPEATQIPNEDLYNKINAYSVVGRPDLGYAVIQTAAADNPEFILPTTTQYSFNKDIYVNKTNSNMQTTITSIPTTQTKYLFSKTWPVWSFEALKAYLIPTLIIIASAGVLFLFTRMFYQIYLNHQGVKFDVGEFCNIGGSENGLATNIKDLIEREIFRFERSPSANYLHINQPLVNIEISAETTIISKDVSTLFNLLNKIFPPKVATLMGVLHPSTINGCGLTLRITGPDGNIVDMCTLWQKIYDPKFKGSQKSDTKQEDALCDYNALIKPAAFWTFWHITNDYNTDLSYHRKNLIRIFGTCDLLAGIMNYVGAGLMGENDSWAKKQIDESLKRDNSNLQAIYNQAQLEISEISEKNEKLLNKYSDQWIPPITPIKTDKRDWEIDKKTLLLSYNPVISKLIKIVSSLRKFESRKNYERSILYIFSLYHLGAIFEYLYTFTRMEDGLKWDDQGLMEEYKFYDEKRITPASKQKKPNFTLLEMSNHFFNEANKLVEIRKIPSKGNNLIIPQLIVKTKNVSLDNALKITVAKLSKLNFSKDNFKTLKDRMKNSINDPEEKGYYSPYNLACFHSLVIGKILREYGKDDEDLKYHKEQAFKHLKENGIDDLFNDPWASKDPSLYPLRFYLMNVQKKGNSKPPTPKVKFPATHAIHAIYGLPRQFEIKLEDILGAEKTDELLEIGATLAGRKYMQEKTGLPIELINNWIEQADLLQLPGMTGEIAWLLIEAGTKTLMEMRKIDDYVVHEKLARINETYNLSTKLPGRELLRQWQETAKKATIIFDM